MTRTRTTLTTIAAAAAAVILFIAGVYVGRDTTTTRPERAFAEIPGATFDVYRVVQGDTFLGIATKLAPPGITSAQRSTFATAIARTNRLTTTSTIQPGNALIYFLADIPTPPTPPTTTSTTTTTIPATTTTTAPVGFADIPTDPAVVASLIEPRTLQPASSGNGEGAFRFLCAPTHLAYDDPVIYPGQPGASHLHQFFGNTLTDANSTFQTLRTTGDGSCQGGVLNRSAYWTPALLNGAGQVVNPDFAVIYYKTAPEDAPTLTQLPNGLRYIAGVDPSGTIPDANLFGSPNPGVAGGFEFHPAWRCVDPTGNTRNLPGTLNGYSVTIPLCQPGDQLFSVVAFPWCFDGRTDSANHRAHVVYPLRDPATGQTPCPADHPLVLPKFTIQVVYSVAVGDNTADWFLSSDRMPGHPIMPSGSTLHADWFGAWDPTIIATWTQKCLREVRDSVAADYCDGTGGKQPANWAWTNPVHLSPIPPGGM